MFSLFSCLFMPHAEIERQPQTEWKKTIAHLSNQGNNQFAPGCELCFPMDFMVSCPKPAVPWKKPGCELCFPMDFMVSEAPNLHSLGKTNSHLGAHCVFPWFHGLRSPKPAFIWKKPIFAPGCELCFLMDFGPQTCIPFGKKTNWELGGGLGWWGGGVAGSAFLTTSNEFQTDLNMTSH